MLRVLQSICRKLWFLSACKKSTSCVTSFLRYCKDTANLLFWELREHLTISIKITVSVWTKLSWLSECKISTASITSLLRCYREIANLLYWVIKAWMATQNKNDSITLKKPSVFISRQKMNFILHVFLEILERYCKPVVLGTLSMPGYVTLSDTLML